jgi:hypothetical protein
MAKGNLFQGMGRGKVGDVVFSRLNGQQISRVRNRNPKNPRTNAQLYQRAIMATVMQAYSAGIAIFDHSFQGKEVGAQNQRRFMSLNAKLLRSQIAADINGNVTVASQVGRVVAPGVTSPVAACLQVSEGSLVNTLLVDTVPEAASSSEKVSEYCARLGLVAGDLFTFVAFVKPDEAATLFTLAGDNTVYSKQFETHFVFARYAVKASALTNTTDAINNLGQVLELTDSNLEPTFDFANLMPGDAVPKLNLFGEGYSGSYAWIRSRVNEDLRSTAELAFDGSQFGIASEFALAAWKQGAASLGDSDLILEGGDI